MEKDYKYRLIFKDSENRAVFVDMNEEEFEELSTAGNDRTMHPKLFELLSDYSSVLKKEIDYKNQAGKNDQEVETKKTKDQKTKQDRRKEVEDIGKIKEE